MSIRKRTQEDGAAARPATTANAEMAVETPLSQLHPNPPANPHTRQALSCLPTTTPHSPTSNDALDPQLHLSQSLTPIPHSNANTLTPPYPRQPTAPPGMRPLIPSCVCAGWPLRYDESMVAPASL
jgi:hypothetical protein